MPSYSAIVLSAGSGKRMGSDMPKQYLPVLGRPLLAYTLLAFEKSCVDEIILVTTEAYREYCARELVEQYGIAKVHAIVIGGKERYDSVYAGLEACRGDYVLIHDGARAMITPEIINRAAESVQETGASVVGMPVKDTIKIVDDDQAVQSTPDRPHTWLVQTPQCFARNLITAAYRDYFASGRSGATDDAMILETMTDHKVYLIEGSYENSKVTTPDDLELAAAILRSHGYTES